MRVALVASWRAMTADIKTTQRQTADASCFQRPVVAHALDTVSGITPKRRVYGINSRHVAAFARRVVSIKLRGRTVSGGFEPFAGRGGALRQ